MFDGSGCCCLHKCVCVRACVHACVRLHTRACVRACMCLWKWITLRTNWHIICFLFSAESERKQLDKCLQVGFQSEP